MNDCGPPAELVLAVRTHSVHYCSPEIMCDTVLWPPVSVLVCVGCVGVWVGVSIVYTYVWYFFVLLKSYVIQCNSHLCLCSCVCGVCGCVGVGEYSIHICMVFVRSPQIMRDTVLRPPVSVFLCVYRVWMWVCEYIIHIICVVFVYM